MISLRAMTETEFEVFKTYSHQDYAINFCKVEDVPMETALNNVAEQFSRLVPNGLKTPGQLFFAAIETSSGKSVGYLWLGIQDRFGRKVTSINDIMIKSERRGEGFGKALMICVEDEARKAGSSRVRLHVFQHNEKAKGLYESMGFQISNVDMFKLLAPKTAEQ